MNNDEISEKRFFRRLSGESRTKLKTWCGHCHKSNYEKKIEIWHHTTKSGCVVIFCYDCQAFTITRPREVE